MRPKRAFPVGTLRVRGRQVAFEPAPSLDLQLPSREEVDLVLAYEYDEASRLREAVRISFTLQPQGGEDRTREVWIKDRPLVRDFRRGVLAHRLPPSPGTEASGAFTVETLYATQPWLPGGEPRTSEAPVRHAGTYRVRFATTSPARSK